MVSRSSTFAFAEMPEVLADALGSAADAERLVWLALPEASRARAIGRQRVIDRFHSEGEVYTAERAAADAGLSLSRFYRIAREWEDVERRSLRLLGVGAGSAGPPRTRRGTTLSKLASERALSLVEADPDDRIAVSAHVRSLGDYLRMRGYEPPTQSSLRSIVVEARRRRDASDRVGLDIAFDTCACAMRDSEGDVYRITVCIDRGTGVVLGGALADPRRTVVSCAAAARDVLIRSGAASPDRYPWVRMERCEFVIGTDLAEARAWEAELDERFPGIGVKASNRPRRFGRYVREHVGIAIGALRVLPTLTISGSASERSAPIRRFETSEAEARLALEIGRHNAGVLSRLATPVGPVPPRTVEFLEFMAASG